MLLDPNLGPHCPYKLYASVDNPFNLETWRRNIVNKQPEAITSVNIKGVYHQGRRASFRVQYILCSYSTVYIDNSWQARLSYLNN